MDRMRYLSCILMFFSHFLCSHSIVFVHIGVKLPSYLHDAVVQARLFNQECSIYLIANQCALDDCTYHDDRFFPVSTESLEKTDEHVDFLRKNKLNHGFWLYASERFLYLYDLMRQYELEDVVHLENDNMLYVDLTEIMPILKKEYSGIAAVFDNDDRCIPGFVYIKDTNSIKSLVHYFIHYSKYKKNDMQVLAIFRKSFPHIIGFLPIIPPSYLQHYELKSSRGYTTGQPESYYNNYQLFNSIFDGAALGQYLGGCDPILGIYPPGFINESCLFSPRHFIFEWHVDKKNRKIPYVLFKDERFKINNLHVHSKNLRIFSSLGESI